jgi:hypothetical protein
MCWSLLSQDFMISQPSGHSEMKMDINAIIQFHVSSYDDLSNENVSPGCSVSFCFPEELIQ